MPSEAHEVVDVVLIEDERLLADALATALPEQDGFRILGIAGTLAAGVELVRAQQPDLVVADYRLPDGDVVDHLPHLLEAAPRCRVLVYTGWADESGLVRALDAGAGGYVEKSASMGQFADAARRVVGGELVVAPRLLPALTRRALDRRSPQELTARELEVLELIAAGRNTGEIADQLFLARNTVRNNIARILAKLGARSRLEAVRLAVARGLIRYDPPR